ncbi:MAG: hypothetical protein OXL34_02085 [Gemmatimonadota bacterium]|nr:hypothetical protein [Gemmatimonadota bacterium]
MNDRPARFSDEQVAHILKRAAEMDARGDLLSAEELRGIAAEAGIDPRATDAAIQELLAEEKSAPVTSLRPGSSVVERSPQVPATKTGLSLPWRIAAGGAVGAASGFIYGLPVGDILIGDVPLFTGNMVIGLGTVMLYLIARAVMSMKRGGQRDFQFENLAVWIGAALVTIPRLAHVMPLDDILAPLIVAWFLVSVVGGLLVRLGRKDESVSDEPPRIGAGTG